jgi:HPt (histidine-containing phosphotransfer) domain-containing protein
MPAERAIMSSPAKRPQSNKVNGMPERTATQEDHPFFIEKDLEEFRALMTAAEVTKWLTRLSDELHTTFFDQDRGAIDRSHLALQLHAIVAQAGFLGFSELSWLCSALEEACHTRADLLPAYQEASVAAHSVRRMIATLQ